VTNSQPDTMSPILKQNYSTSSQIHKTSFTIVSLDPHTWLRRDPVYFAAIVIKS